MPGVGMGSGPKRVRGTVEALESGDPRKLGRYQIIGRLGSGGMGRVYLGRSQSGRMVAVKVVRPELTEDGDFRRRFAREVAAARRVSGFFTAGVIDADPDGSPAWLATAYVPGVSLSEAIATHGPWPESSVLTLGLGLAEALEAIHAAGVIHRDLKPANVLLAVDGPRVIDFGISVASGTSTLTPTGMTVGTPGFMAPEQLTGKPVSPATDIFALGAVLTFTATGTGPFGTGSLHAVHFRSVYEQPDLGRLPPRLRGIVANCLAKEPGQRPGAAALLERLADAGYGQNTHPILAETGWLPASVAEAVRTRVATSQPSTAPAPLPTPEPARPSTQRHSSDSAAPVVPPRPTAAPRVSAEVPRSSPRPRPVPGPPEYGVPQSGGVAARRSLYVPREGIHGTGDGTAVQLEKRGRFKKYILVLALAVLGGAVFGGYHWTQTQYYVGTNGEHVALYRGISQNLAWMSLSKVETDHPEIKLKYLPPYQQMQVRATITEDGLQNARKKIDELSVQASACKKASERRNGDKQLTLTEEEQKVVSVCGKQ
ncbi:protein kinase [Streptomyces sp. NPDC055692]|uniref:protein kinase domain-containing protein n=1 Tax=Streptomyces sp. NPDC055692 TaxID=3155683 RepID=UPI00343B2B0A